MVTVLERLYSTLVEDDEAHGRGDLPDSHYRAVDGNTARVISGFLLQKVGDRIADPKTFLPWMLTFLGAPVSSIALLVPIREAAALIPQTFLVPAVRRLGLRSRVWAAGATGQSLAIAAIGLVGFTTTGLALGVATLIALGLFAVARAVSSISAGDILNKTVPPGDRGSVAGISTFLAGLAAIGAGITILITLRHAAPTALALVVAGSALLWLGAGASVLRIDEKPTSRDRSDPAPSIGESFSLLTRDRPFRRFVFARSFMLVSALSPPIVVSLSATNSGSSASGVGLFIAATGIAGTVAIPAWRGLADRSPRLLMAATTAGASVVIAIHLTMAHFGFDTRWWFGPATYLLLAFAHSGARMGRRTYLDDLSGINKKTPYVAVSNAVIGLVLLAVGAATAAVALVNPKWALVGFATAGGVGSLVALSMDKIPSRRIRHHPRSH